jgi:hypothetical protein
MTRRIKIVALWLGMAGALAGVAGLLHALYQDGKPPISDTHSQHTEGPGSPIFNSVTAHDITVNR